MWQHLMWPHRCAMVFEDGRASCIEDKTPCPNRARIDDLTRARSELIGRLKEKTKLEREIHDLEMQIRDLMAEITSTKVRSI